MSFPFVEVIMHLDDIFLTQPYTKDVVFYLLSSHFLFIPVYHQKLRSLFPPEQPQWNIEILTQCAQFVFDYFASLWF